MIIKRRKPQDYQVVWEWTNGQDMIFGMRQITDYVFASTAERAIAKVRKQVMDEYADVQRKDITIISVTIV